MAAIRKTIELSIIIPCYNSEETLREAVKSCYTQGFSSDKFEIVMVNDGSTDGTRDLIEKLAKEYENIKYISHDQNKGGGAARNTAVENSAADVIFCLDSDDILPPRTLNKMYAYIQEKNCDGVGLHHSTKFIDRDQNAIRQVDTLSFSGKIIPLDSLLQKNGVLCPLYSVFMFTKNAFAVTRGYPTEHGFDTQGFAWRFLGSGLTAYTCPDTNYLHRVDFHESYYLREYNAGKNNFNWKTILLEFEELFTDEVVNFITHYNCKDFTTSLIDDLSKRSTIFRTDSKISAVTPKKRVSSRINPIPRNSLTGIYFRIARRLQKYLAK